MEAFGANFQLRGELGASVCVYREGRKVVDLWGGHTDPARQEVWQAGTMVSMASVVKGMLAYLMTEVQWHEKCAVWGTPMRTALGILVNDPEFF
ncbi:MAG: serine hydrolase [Gammaproteobacteria bacterium]|nr:serine hydrolase [Gammaproteobacteria bacterium]